MAFITIVETDEAFDWQPKDDSTGQKYESSFKLRIVSDDIDAEIRKKYTRPTFDNPARSRVDRLDQAAYAAAVLDYAIVSWAGIKAAGTGADVPCTAAMKARLPERWKSEILRLCSLKEAGEMIGSADQEKKALPTT